MSNPNAELKAKLAAAIQRLRAAVAEIDSMESRDDKEAAALASQRELYMAALQDITAIGPKADTETIRDALRRVSRWIAASKEELDADTRGRWKRAGDK